MQCLNALRASALRVSIPTKFNLVGKRFRQKSICETHLFSQDPKPCFDLRNVTVEKAHTCNAPLIKSFLYTHYWPREPSVIGLWMPINSPYLELLSDKYANSGDRLIAYERLERTGERKMIGLSVANKIYPWMVEEIEDWGHVTCAKPERFRIFFCAHCLKNPDLFKKYNVDYIYHIEVLGTVAEVTGQGVGTLLLKSALASAEELRHPLVQVVSVSQYTSKICEKCGMKLQWTMDYTDFVDEAGQRVFYPRRPHHTVKLYVKYFDPKLGGVLPCQPQYT